MRTTPSSSAPSQSSSGSKCRSSKPTISKTAPRRRPPSCSPTRSHRRVGLCYSLAESKSQSCSRTRRSWVCATTRRVRARASTSLSPPRPRARPCRRRRRRQVGGNRDRRPSRERSTSLRRDDHAECPAPTSPLPRPLESRLACSMASPFAIGLRWVPMGSPSDSHCAALLNNAIAACLFLETLFCRQNTNSKLQCRLGSALHVNATVWTDEQVPTPIRRL